MTGKSYVTCKNVAEEALQPSNLFHSRGELLILFYKTSQLSSGCVGDEQRVYPTRKLPDDGALVVLRIRVVGYIGTQRRSRAVLEDRPEYPSVSIVQLIIVDESSQEAVVTLCTDLDCA